MSLLCSSCAAPDFHALVSRIVKAFILCLQIGCHGTGHHVSVPMRVSISGLIDIIQVFILGINLHEARLVKVLSFIHTLC